MQKQTYSQKKLSRAVFAAFLISIVLLVAALFMPQQAEAKSYTMPEVAISADAAADGNLNVIENRTFSFDGTFSAVWWTFEGLPTNATLEVNGAYITYANSEPIWLDRVSFNLAWREAGGPGGLAYSVDSPKDTVYVFFQATDEILDIQLDYTVKNGVKAYKDVSEVYWKYIGTQWAEASENVTMTLRLPIPADTEVVAGENVRAWGHGPLTGTLAINGDGSVTYEVNKVRSGDFAEARVVFPREWLTSLEPTETQPYASTTALSTILKEEQEWTDEVNRQRVASLAVLIGFILVSILLIVWVVLSFHKYGKEYPPDFTESYWREAPSKEDHPLVMARLWRWKRESKDDFTTELMYLTHIGAVQMHQGTYKKRKKVVDDYYLVRVPEVEATLENPIDIETMNLLFEVIAGGGDSLWFKSIEAYGNDHAEEFVDRFKKWQGVITGETNKREFFELKGERYQTYIVGIMVVYALLAAFLCFTYATFIPLLFVVPTVIVSVVIANYLPRRSQEGNNLNAKCKGLRNWLKDFSALDERPPTDVKVWGEFMVYAYIFGIAKEVMKTLRVKVPEIFEDTGAYAGSYVPWWVWYGTGMRASGSAMPSASDMLRTSVSNTISSAQAAVSGASGNFSSGGGFGGGFSGGGGGGFGGGGGAR